MKRAATDANAAGDGAPGTCRVHRFTARGRPVRELDHVAIEEPLEVRIDSRSIAVIMRTPGHDEELAVGFLRSEGILGRREDLVAVRPNVRNRTGNSVDVFLASDVRVDLARLSRHVFVASSCGLCGSTSIAAVRRRFPAVRARFKVSAATLLSLPAKMRDVQATFASTGGVHGAALFTRDGELLYLREDVGRHNAVDKILGRLWLDGRDAMADHVLLVSGRVSFEIVQKALAGGLAFVAAVSAPSSLAVDFARRSGQTLVGFLRPERFNVYAGPGRIRRSP